MSVVVAISALKRRSSSLFWVLGSYAAIICRSRLAPRRPLARSRSFVVALRSNRPQPLGTVDGNRQFVRLNDSTEIEEGSSRGGYRDAVVHGEVLGSAHAGPVHPHARWALPPGDHDHLHVRCIRAEPPQVRRRAVAKPGAGPAGHHCREIPTARRNLRHPDGIDAAVHAVQQALLDSSPDPVPVEPQSPVTAAPRSPHAVERPALRSPDRPQVRNPSCYIRHSDYSPGQGGTGGVTGE